MSTARVVIDGVKVHLPQCLTYPELVQLCDYNGDRNRGIVFNPDTAARMRQLEIRFSWFGYITEDGAAHVGNEALPTVFPVPSRRAKVVRRIRRVVGP